MQTWASLMFLNHDGRIWTDKTVRHDLGSLEDDQFEVTLSALAQSAPRRTGYQIPADTVFTIDVSGSMTRVDSGEQRSRIALLIDALNEAISILQEANPSTVSLLWLTVVVQVVMPVFKMC